jgi:cbb3-type cytochrome oxidase subunit 3
MGLTNLGIFHTIIGIIAIVAALTSFVKHGKINLYVLSGKIYVYGTIVTSLTALGISKLGGFNPGHAFALFIVILVLVAYYLHLRKKGNTRARYFENFSLSLSLFLSLIPTVSETFRRVPIGHPLAKDPADPSIAKTLLVLLILFVVGAVYQFRQQKKINAAVGKQIPD